MTSSELADYAKSVCEAEIQSSRSGFTTFPLKDIRGTLQIDEIKKAHDVAKEPTVKWGDCDHATEAQIRTRRTRNGILLPVGYAIRCGLQSDGRHLFVVDLDPREDRDGISAFKAIARDIGEPIPTTFTVITPSGGYHLYFISPHPIRKSQGKLAPGIDIQGEGSYVVGPGVRTRMGEYRVGNFPM